MRSRPVWSLTCFLISFALAVPGVGQERRPPDLAPPATMVAILNGEQIEPGSWKFSVEPGPVVSLAMVFFSEPSHKLLGIVMDHKFHDSKEGAKWLEDKTRGASDELPVETANLPDQTVTIRLLPFAKGDEKYSPWVLNDWVDGKRELRRIFTSRPGHDRIESGFLVDSTGRHVMPMSVELARRVAGHPERWPEVEKEK